MMVHCNFESLSCLQMEGVVKGLGVQQHGEAVGLANLNKLSFVTILNAFY